MAFIGISNWALDPAKMNRGIMVRRSDPTVADLIESAKYEIVYENISLVSLGEYVLTRKAKVQFCVDLKTFFPKWLVPIIKYLAVRKKSFLV